MYDEHEAMAMKTEDPRAEAVAKALEVLDQALDRVGHQVERCGSRLVLVLRPQENAVPADSLTAVQQRQPSPIVERLEALTRAATRHADALAEYLSRCDL